MIIPIRKITIQLLLSLCLISFSTNIYAQLSGIYTIGPSDCDYFTPRQAMSSLHSLGNSDTVVFLIEEGTYIFDNQYIPDELNPSFLTIFKSASDNPSDVIFNSDDSCSIYFYNFSNIKFNSITFGSEDNQSTLQLSHCENIIIDSCVVLSDTIAFSSLTIYSDFTNSCISNSIISGGKLSISNNESNTMIKNNTFNCQFSTSGRLDSIINNTFNGDTEIPTLSKVIGNTFNGNVHNSFAGSVYIENNVFNGEFSDSFSNNMNIFSNTFNAEFHSSYPDDIKIHSNVFKDNAEIHFPGFNNKIYNNHFHGHFSTWVAAQNGLEFYYNNVKGYFEIFHHNSNKIKNNIFGDSFTVLHITSNTTNISNNNHYPGYGTLGIHNYHYDPKYLNEDTLIATNPLLIGKGTSILYYNYDMPRNIRSDWPTIGANELYLTQDTLKIMCSDGIRLIPENYLNLEEGYWLPETYMEDPNETYPIVYPYEDITYYFYYDDVIIDSICLINEPFELQMPQTSTVRCGNEAIIYSAPHENSDLFNWQWTPDSFSYSQSGDLWYATVWDTTTFTLNLFHEYCGSSSGGVTINVDPLPTANGTYSQIDGVSIQFESLCSCEDSLKWYFGDGSYSTESNPIHSYLESDYYIGSIVAYNSYGKDSVNFILLAPEYNSINGFNIDTNISIFPNPSTGVINLISKELSGNVLIELFDIQGKKLHSNTLEFKQNDARTLDFSNQNEGIYLIKLQYDEGVIIKKIVFE
ncbi:MAG: hypothetical protein C0596_09085 [Marinilabiliales bacterium]|nr:MAG: hypothetical protein C0596_09085 [Marinilabiliales bacterium]